MNIWHACPAAAIEWNAHYQLAPGHSRLQISIDGVVDVEVFRGDRILRAVVKGRIVVRAVLPRAVEVVTLHVIKIECAADVGQFNIREILLSGGTEHGQQIVPMIGASQRVQLPAELAHQERNVRCIGSSRELPVDVDTIEDASRRDSRGDITVDEQINAGSDEGLPSGLGSGSGREAGRARQRDQDLQVRMQLLELLQGGEVSVERTRVRSCNGGERRLVVGKGIGDDTAGTVHAAEGIEEMRESISHSIVLQVGDVEVREVDAPFLEIATDHFLAIIGERRAAGGQKRSDQKQTKQRRRERAWETMGTHRGSSRMGIQSGGSIDLYSSCGNWNCRRPIDGGYVSRVIYSD